MRISKKLMIDRNDLLDWLKKIDRKLKRKIELIAVGGTAMTLLGLKSSTRDVDFCLDSENEKMFREALDGKFIVDIFTDGYIFSEQLPVDYKNKAKELAVFDNITLKALDPVDIIITKAARLNARDEEDIVALAKHVDRKDLIERFEEIVVSYAGDAKRFKYHFELILKRYFR